MTTEYQYLKKLGEGGFGEVYLAKNINLEKIQVIKKISIKYYSKYVRNELAIMCNVNHPRVVRLMNFFPTKEHFNIVMEYCSGGTLRDFIIKFQKHHYKLERLIIDEWFMDIAMGVKYLHSKKIMHRDLKPENILVTATHRMKVSDFGVSKISHNLSPMNQTMIGTLSYMSPEVYLHKPYNDSCDIWSLGLILYEIAMMKYAFTRDEKADILNPNHPFVPPKINYERYKYGASIQEVLEMMVQRDPMKRFNIYSIIDHERYVEHLKSLQREERLYYAALKLKK